VSHFVIDAIPHWDYPLQSIATGVTADNRQLNVSGALVRDLALIGFDACAGLALAMVLFANPMNAWIVALGATAGMLPDPLQFLYSVYPREPLKSLQQFHSWMHSNKRLQWRLGVSSQAGFAALVAVLALH